MIKLVLYISVNELNELANVTRILGAYSPFGGTPVNSRQFGQLLTVSFVKTIWRVWEKYLMFEIFKKKLQ